MSVLQNKIDFAVVLRVKHANPNGDPLNGNRPRTDYNGFGEITDVCLKRKIRDRLQEAGFAIFVQSDDRKTDGAKHLKERAESEEWGLGKQAFQFRLPKTGKKAAVGIKEPEENTDLINSAKHKTVAAACLKWMDVRTFGNLFAWAKANDADSVSVAIRGPVTVQSAFSVNRVEVTSTQITKSVSGDSKKTKNAASTESEQSAGVEGERSSDTMGMKHRIDQGTYVFYGSMNPQLAERTGFSGEDAEAIKQVLPKLFENDASSARPEGSMEILKVIWWKHNSKAGQYSSAKVHRTLKVKADGEIGLDELEGLVPEVIDGF